MPWTSKDSIHHTKKATTPVAQRQWKDVANSMLRRGKSEGTAIRAASGVVRKRRAKH